MAYILTDEGRIVVDTTGAVSDYEYFIIAFKDSRIDLKSELNLFTKYYCLVPVANHAIVIFD